MKNCVTCGISSKTEDEKIECMKYKRIQKSPNIENNCLYYIEFKFEEGELLNPLQHLLLKEQELKSKHMKNTI
ncbi:hypothetical protein ACTPDI_17705 [Clostridioides difficile]|uniref:hypothetical protein n=1 Tax=Clostridioides sp. ZZV15-6598 TaxID=2811501 RepID=UPI001D10FA6E|nr:hypothetical protein [Clostridioides sp. ZZV15-6598]